MEEVFQLNTHLHFGAIVHLSHFVDRSNFYLFSNGVSYRNLMGFSANDPPTEISKALFRVKPVIKFQSEEFLEGIVKERYSEARVEEKDEKKAKVFIDQFEFELKQNMSYSEQQSRFPIKYNESFMLQHVYSCKYLSLTKSRESNQLLLELSELPTTSSVFNLQACYNYQKDINTYIPFNSAAFLNAKVSDGLDIKDLYLNFRKDSVFECWRIEEEQKAVVSVGLYQTAQEIEYKEICYGDTVWIFHLESGSFVKVRQDQASVDSYIMNKIKYSLGYVRGEFEDSEKADSAKGAPEVLLQKTENEMTAEKFGLWQIVYASEKGGSGPNRKEHSDRFKGGRVKFDQEVRFFNLRYKEYLSVRKIKVGRNKHKLQLCTEQFEEENTTFKVKSLSPNSLYCTSEDLFIIQHVLTESYLTLAEPFGPADGLGRLEPSGEYKKEDNFKLTKIEFVQEWQNNYILSIIPFLGEGARIFQRMGFDGLLAKKEAVLAELLLENLIELLSFSYDLTEGFEASENKLGKMTYNHYTVQKLLKEQGVIDLLVAILRAINLDVVEFHRSEFKKFNHGGRPKSASSEKMSLQPQPQPQERLRVRGTLKIIKNFAPDLSGEKKKERLDPRILNSVINVTFKILRNCCKSNTENSILLFGSMKTFTPFLSLGGYAERFFVDSFVNTAIMQQIGEKEFREIIGQYIFIFNKSQEHSPEVFNLLINFLKVNEKSISKNQVEIYKLFFEEFNPLVLQMEGLDGRFYISYKRMQYELHSFSQTFRNKEEVTTLAAQIKFFANLTFDRNYLCSKQIKLRFPLEILLFYLKSSICPEIKEGLIHILTHTYLNERPRFKEKTNFIYSFYGIHSKEEFQQSVNRKQSKGWGLVQGGYEFELKEMEMRGLSRESQREILSCIEDVDHIGATELEEMKEWLKGELQGCMEDSSRGGERFYGSVMEASLMCLKEMIELGVFSSGEWQYVEGLLSAVIGKISSSLQLKSEAGVSLEAGNFKALLLEMVEKNVIKRYDYNSRFDGIEDEIGPGNICSIYVNYAFYQNILLLEKSPQKRKEHDRVIERILELIDIYSRIVIEDKLLGFLGDVLQREPHYLHADSKKALIREVITGRVLEPALESRESTFQLLLLLFYNSNTYNINLRTISLFVKEVFSENAFLEQLERIVFIVDAEEERVYRSVVAQFKEVRLLVETSEVWLNAGYDHPRFQYNSILLYFVDRLRHLVALAVRGFRVDSHHHGGTFNVFDSIIGLEPAILRQQQIIFSNLGLDTEVLSFIHNYSYLLRRIGAVTPNNMLVVTLFRTCFLFLYVYIHGCGENKRRLKETIQQNSGSISGFFADLGPVDFGQSKLLVEFLRDNYEESLDFFERNSEALQKRNRYTWVHGELILVLLKYYNESILQNLKRLFISIFDYTSFKHFLWLEKGVARFSLDLNLLVESPYEPVFYHIKMIECLLYLSDNLVESANTVKSHLRKSLSEDYLYSLLQEDDYYLKENSLKTILKLQVIFKSKVIKLIEMVYLFDEKASLKLALSELHKYHRLLSVWIEEAPARQETEDFRKMVPLRDIRGEKDSPIDQRINEIYNSTYRKQFLLEVYIQSIETFCRCVLKNDHLREIHNLGESIVHKIFHLNEILHRAYGAKASLHYPLSNEHNFQILIPPEKPEYARKKYFLSLILEIQYSQEVYVKIKSNKKKLIELFVRSLKAINLKPFLLLRKISEFLEDAFQKLPHDFSGVYENLQMLISLLTIWLRSVESAQAGELRQQIGKSELIFPILNFFESCAFDAENKRLFLVCLEFMTELIGEDGNKFVQTIFNNYFTNKSDSINFFKKIQAILREVSFEEQSCYQCKKLVDGMAVFKREVRMQKTEEFLVLNFLIALCKGNFRENQIFLSSLSHTSNFKIMGGIWDILKLQLQKYPNHLVNNKNYHLITQCFATIRELVEGPCRENQNEFLKREFFITVMQYFQHHELPEQLTLQPELEGKLQQISQINASWASELRTYLNQERITKPWMPSQVKYLCISLISSLLSENINEKSLSQLMTIDPNLMSREMDKVYDHYVVLDLEYVHENLEYAENREVILPLGFRLYEILQYFPRERRPAETPGVKFFREHSRVIEVTHNDLCIVYFPKPTLEISEAFRQEFLENVDRTSINSKLRDLQNVEIQNRQSDYPYGYLFFLVVCLIIALDFIILTSTVLTFVKDFSLYSIFEGYHEFAELTTLKALLLIVALMQSALYFILELRGAVYLQETVKKILESDFGRAEKAMVIARLFYRNLSYFYYLMALLLLVLGLLNPFFDAILLVTELFRRNQTFSIILRAITETLDQLCITLLVLLIATYILTSIIYYYYGLRYYEEVCSNLYFCFVFSLDQGFKEDAGMVASTDGDDPTTDFLSATFGDMLLNFIYLFIIKLIISEIIGAIIVDKFAAIREQKESLEQDENSLCFICGIDRNTLDREEDGFQKHKAKYHNVFNYMEFLIHIQEARKANLSGIERFVLEEKHKGKLTWFPINRSFHLESRKKLQEESLESGEQEDPDRSMKQLDQQIHDINYNLTQMNELVSIKLAKNKSRL